MSRVDWRRITIIAALAIMLFTVIILAIGINQFSKEIKSLQEDSIKRDQRIEQYEKEIETLRVELNTHRSWTKAEIEDTWRFRASVRNNFIALGHGFMLDKKDIAPGNEVMMANKKK